MNREDDGGRDGLGIPLTAAIHCEPDIQTTNREDEYLTLESTVHNSYPL
jgi:hypothetical protein